MEQRMIEREELIIQKLDEVLETLAHDEKQVINDFNAIITRLHEFLGDTKIVVDLVDIKIRFDTMLTDQRHVLISTFQDILSLIKKELELKSCDS